MFGALDWIKLGAGALIGASVAYLPVYHMGKSAGRHEARVDQLEADVEAYAKREGIEDEVDGMDRYRICLDLGGLPDECERLRGWRKPPAANDPVGLVQREEGIARYLVTTDRFGRSQGCWK